MRVFLCNPPTVFIRDERCQIDVDSRLAENIREPIQALYLAGLLQKYKHDVFLRDYSSSHLAIKDVLLDINSFEPNFFYLETTQGTFSSDMNFIRSINEHNNEFSFIAKAPFLDFLYLKKQVDNLNLDINAKVYFITRDFEITINNILLDKGKNREISNAYVLIGKEIYQSKNNNNKDNGFNMDSYPLPPRYFLNRYDYVRPDTGEPIAYIFTSKGCPYDCIFCSAPVYLGKKVQIRSVDSVVSEIKECVNRYDISNFFFRSDTFTFDKKWVMDFCEKVIKERIKIQWGTNSRVDRGDMEMFTIMKKAGCDIIGFGIESGSNLILRKIRKNISIRDIKYIHGLVKGVGIKTFFHCIVGFPWDSCETIEETKKLLLEIEPDFIEVNVPYPLKGTELYNFAEKNNLFVSKDLESYSHIKPILRTFSLETDRISRLRKDLIASFYLRPKYIIRKLRSIRHPKVFFNYAKWGCRLMKKIFL